MVSLLSFVHPSPPSFSLLQTQLGLEHMTSFSALCREATPLYAGMLGMLPGV
jgi:hypothetical protein